MAGAARSGVLLACDLDNTLLYSYRRRRPGDVCVEWRQGREQGYMPPEAVALLERLAGHGIRLVPVTARSVEQYGRIAWPQKETPRTALVAGGAVRLADGAIDSRWYEASLALAAPYLAALERLKVTLEACPQVELCRMVEGCILFARCSDEAAAARLAARPGEGLVLVAQGRKLYAAPPGLDKGHALERLPESGDGRPVIGAGDSLMDVPMLARCRLAIVPDEALAARVGRERCVVWDGQGSFPAFVLRSALAFAARADLK